MTDKADKARNADSTFKADGKGGARARRIDDGVVVGGADVADGTGYCLDYALRMGRGFGGCGCYRRTGCNVLLHKSVADFAV